MSDPYVAEIRVFPFNFAPKGWAQCNGQLLPISQNTALFSLLGTTYGGDGKTTFALPNLQGRVPVHVGSNGQGPGLSQVFLGEESGSETVTLLESEMPAHVHSASGDSGIGNSNDPAGALPARPFGGGVNYAANSQTAAMAAEGLAATGESAPHNNYMPSLVFNFCIAMQGVFPPRQ